MTTNEELKEVKWFGAYDQKMHTCRINLGDENLDINELITTMDDVAKNQEDKCKLIYYLGVAITGTPSGARGFLDGWLARSLKNKFEEQYGKWTIQHEIETMSNEEIKSHFVNMLRDAADKIDQLDELDPKKIPTVNTGRDNGTELFD